MAFNIKRGGSPKTDIPTLKDFSYNFYPGIDKKNQVFGIEHQIFNRLKSSVGVPLDNTESYLIYNTFIDFHGFCNIFAQPSDEGAGIQDIKKIGQKIIHSAAHSQPPTHLGENILQGSFFKNGEIKMELKGISEVNQKECALLGYDSGQSSFKMIMEPAPGIKIVTQGSSHYGGDIYKDLQSNWIQKVQFQEWVVSETLVTKGNTRLSSVIERNAVILNLDEAHFYDALK